METTIYAFRASFYLPPIQIYRMCAYLVHITVVSCDAQPSNFANYFNMFYVVVIIIIGSLQAFLIKYNPNTMVKIEKFL